MSFCRISVVWICETKSVIADMTEQAFSMRLLEGLFAQDKIMREIIHIGVGESSMSEIGRYALLTRRAYS